MTVIEHTKRTQQVIIDLYSLLQVDLTAHLYHHSHYKNWQLHNTYANYIDYHIRGSISRIAKLGHRLILNLLSSINDWHIRTRIGTSYNNGQPYFKTIAHWKIQVDNGLIKIHSNLESGLSLRRATLQYLSRTLSWYPYYQMRQQKYLLLFINELFGTIAEHFDIIYISKGM